MKPDDFFAYIRISDKKQKRGASIEEQRRVILRCAEQKKLPLGECITEVLTASKAGRPLFERMLRQLRAGKAKGVIIHKIDRSARNMKEWGDITELLDAGTQVYSAADGIDLQTRSGRLTADLLASIACDYSRNLRSEVRKGIEGRLHQGLWPFAAPLGYLDTGPGGKVKEVDRDKAEKILETFRAFATAEHSIVGLREFTKQVGLTTRAGKALTRSELHKMLRNPFYMGLMRQTATGEVFRGLHKPIVPPDLFERVQRVLDKRLKPQKCRHDYLFRRVLRCAHCQYSLVGERQKGRVYYRCHTSDCPTTSVREDTVDAALLGFFRKHRPHPGWRTTHLRLLEAREEERARSDQRRRAGLRLKDQELCTRRDKLLDALLDDVIDKQTYLRRKERLERQIAALEAKIDQAKRADARSPKRVRKKLELLEALVTTYVSANRAQKRRIVRFATSNLQVSGRSLCVKPIPALRTLSRSPESQRCGHLGDGPRTLATVLCDAVRELEKRYPEHLSPPASPLSAAHQ